MRLSVLGLCAFGLASAVIAPAQSFDVASIKPHPASGDNRVRVMMDGGPGSDDPGRINYENVTLKDVLMQAFDVRSYQLTMPASADSDRFDITAKIPQGTTKEQFRVMLQKMLTERFGMTYHREKKELPAYVLVVGKNGPKLKESADAPATPSSPNGRPANFMRMMPGKATVSGNAMAISQLVNMLSNQVDRPLVDETGLKGKYAFTLEFAPEMRNMPGFMPGRGVVPGAGAGEPGGPAPEGESAPSLFTAVQEQLGLKLEPRKALLDLIIVDHIEKTPVEN